MLIDRACPEGGWNAGNAVVYGVPLRPHVDATALALAALRAHHNLPIVRDSLTWILNRIDCPSPYSLAWVILAAAAYKEVRSDVSAGARCGARPPGRAGRRSPKTPGHVHDRAGRSRPGAGNCNQPVRGKGVSMPMNRRIFGGSLLAGTGALAVRRLCSTGRLRDRRKSRSPGCHSPCRVLRRPVGQHADCRPPVVRSDPSRQDRPPEAESGGLHPGH